MAGLVVRKVGIGMGRLGEGANTQKPTQAFVGMFYDLGGGLNLTPADLGHKGGTQV